MWLRFQGSSLGAGGEGELLSSNGSAAREAGPRCHPWNSSPAGALSLDCSFLPTFCGLGFVFPLQTHLVQPHPGNLLYPHPGPHTHSPELALASWKKREEGRCDVRSTFRVLDTVTLDSPEPPKILLFTPRAPQGPSLCGHPPGQEVSALKSSSSLSHSQSYLSPLATQLPPQFWSKFSPEAGRASGLQPQGSGHRMGAGGPASTLATEPN